MHHIHGAEYTLFADSVTFVSFFLKREMTFFANAVQTQDTLLFLVASRSSVSSKWLLETMFDVTYSSSVIIKLYDNQATILWFIWHRVMQALPPKNNPPQLGSVLYTAESMWNRSTPPMLGTVLQLDNYITSLIL